MNMEKLIKIQNELKVPKGNYNSFGKYKYRSCEDILEAVKPLLAKHECTLTLTDDIVLIGSKVFLKSTAKFINETGLCIEVNGFAETSEHKGMSAEQTTGTASSYARKYALNGLFLIDETESDADHDNKQAPTKQIDIEGAKAKLIVSGNLTELKNNWNSLSKDEQASKDIIDFTNNLKAKLMFK